MTSKEALKCIIYRLTAQEDDLELRETAKEEIAIIEKDLEVLEILLKCVRVTTIHYDKDDHSASCEEFCFEFDSLSNEELLKLNKYLNSFLKIEIDLNEELENKND